MIGCVWLATQKQHAVTTNYKQNPFQALHEKLFFVSRKDNSKGLYEEIFNENTKFEDILASFIIWILFNQCFGEIENKNGIKIIKKEKKEPYFSSLAFSNIVLHRYWALKYPNDSKKINLSKIIVTAFEKDDKDKLELFKKTVIFADGKVHSWFVTEEDEINEDKIERHLNSNDFYLSKREEFDNEPFSIEDIDNIIL